MGMKNLINNNLKDNVLSAQKEISKNFKFMEDHLIQIQKNQVEFEKYLKEINKKLEDEDNKTKNN